MTAIAAAEEAAHALLAKHGIASPLEIHAARLAADEGAYVVYGETGGADARTVRSGDRAYIVVDEASKGTPRARWSIAHELGHWVLHKGDHADAIARIHGGGVRSGRDWQYERQADAFGGSFLMPAHLFAPRCGGMRPRLRTLERLGQEFGTSLQATARRYARFATSACAVVECSGGRVFRVARSASFRGTAVERRAVEAGSVAAAVGRGDVAAAGGVVTSGAWGSAKLGVEMREEAVLVPESGVVVVWLWHADR